MYRLASATAHSPVPRMVLIATGFFLLFLAGYAWILSLFLLRVPLLDLDRTIDADEQLVFQVPNVGHFESLEVDPSGTELTYRLPSFVEHTSAATIDVFVAPAPGNDPQDLPPVRFTQGDRSSIVNTTQKEIDWLIRSNDEQRIYSQTVPEVGDDPEALVALRGHHASPWLLAVLLTAAALVALLAAHKIKPIFNISSPSLIPLILLIGGMVLFWSGGLISIDYFGGGHGRLSGMAIHLQDIYETGSLNPTQYRPATFALPALPGVLLEGTQLPLRDIVRVYPVTEYSLFMLVLASFAFLLHAWATRIDRNSATVLAVLLSTFYPFIHDIFLPDTDAFLIPLFSGLTGLVVLWSRPDGLARRRIAFAALPLFVLATSLKATSLVLLIMIPTMVFMAQPNLRRRYRLMQASTAILISLVLLPVGGWLAESVQHPNRSVGVEDLEFQDSAMWHVLWGASGYFDHYTAFGFTKSGRLRNERVSQALDVEIDTYLRQSQAATETVYRPGIITALQEMPSIFYSNMFHRLQTGALRFYRYTGITGGLIEPWTDPDEGRTDYLDGEPSHPPEHRPDHLEEAIRLDRYWRIAPLVFLVQLQHAAMPQALDILLFALAVTGIALIRIPGVRWFLLLGVTFQVAMAAGVHVLVRYGSFLSICGLIGLATFLARSWSLLKGGPIRT